MIRKDIPKYVFAALPALLGLAAAWVPLPAQAATTPTPAGTVISALVTASFQAAASGTSQLVSSNMASVTVMAPPVVTPAPVIPPAATQPVPTTTVTTPTTTRTVGVAVTPASSAQQIIRPALTVYPVTIRNTGSAADTVALSLTRAVGWNAALVYDTYNDGVYHGSGNTVAPAKITLTSGQSQRLLLVVSPPPVVMHPTSGTCTLKVQSITDSTKTAQETVTTTTGVGIYLGR